MIFLACGGIYGGNSLGGAGPDFLPSTALSLWINRNLSLSVLKMIRSSFATDNTMAFGSKPMKDY